MARPTERDGAGYGRFPEQIERDWLGRWCHLSEADLDLVNNRYGETMRLGFAVQLATVRAIGTFLPEPANVPDDMVKALARQLRIACRRSRRIDRLWEVAGEMAAHH